MLGVAVQQTPGPDRRYCSVCHRGPRSVTGESYCATNWAIRITTDPVNLKPDKDDHVAGVWLVHPLDGLCALLLDLPSQADSSGPTM